MHLLAGETATRVVIRDGHVEFERRLDSPVDLTEYIKCSGLANFAGSSAFGVDLDPKIDRHEIPMYSFEEPDHEADKNQLYFCGESYTIDKENSAEYIVASVYKFNPTLLRKNMDYIRIETELFEGEESFIFAEIYMKNTNI